MTAQNIWQIPPKNFQPEVMLCRYQFDGGGRLPPRAPGAFAPKCVPSPRAFAQQKMPGGWAINDDVPGAEHLHQHKEC